jgi:hypothetical protein
MTQDEKDAVYSGAVETLNTNEKALILDTIFELEPATPTELFIWQQTQRNNQYYQALLDNAFDGDDGQTADDRKNNLSIRVLSAQIAELESKLQPEIKFNMLITLVNDLRNIAALNDENAGMQYLALAQQFSELAEQFKKPNEPIDYEAITNSMEALQDELAPKQKQDQQRVKAVLLSRMNRQAKESEILQDMFEAWIYELMRHVSPVAKAARELKTFQTLLKPEDKAEIQRLCNVKGFRSPLAQR